ncbi:hypothetical protein [Spirosoma pollinicola]|uniref:Uncharacterized protein n=1 Tax=Spirosoma pollinicola TaxID=2057025 RepID=A0A2K8ZAA8_9BACT|nr:hypothetical protein [Spirosoma pollinicola]AUD06785.1 hypothetical protein CWM47_36030 [Spirosoma pollinicola]
MEAENPVPTSDTKIDSPSKTNGPVTWSIRGVERDTRSVIEKAAERAGKTMGQYVNEDIRSLVQGQLSQSQLPAAPVDLQNQMDHLTKMVEALTNRMPEQGKKSFWQRLFS